MGWSDDSRCHDHGAFKVQAIRVAETNLSGLSQIFGVCGCLLFGLFDCGTRTVSYTHLDVYKRQVVACNGFVVVNEPCAQEITNQQTGSKSN